MIKGIRKMKSFSSIFMSAMSLTSFATSFANVATVAGDFEIVLLENADLKLGAPGTAGSGCLPGAEIVRYKKDVAGNIRRVELASRKFQVAAGAGKALDRKVCTMAIPFELPRGKTLIIESLEVMGTQDLKGNTVSTVRGETFLNANDDTASLVINEEFRGPLSRKFALKQTQSAAPMDPCANPINKGILRTNVSVVNVSPSGALKASSRLNPVAALNLKVLNCE